MLWAGLVLAILGSAIKQRQMKQSGERKRRELQLGRDKEKAVEGEQRTEVLDEAGQYDPTVRQELLDTEAAKTEDRIKAVLEDNELSTSGDTGVISDALLKQRASSTRDRANTASILAALMSKVQAPGKAGNVEGMDMMDLIADSEGRSKKLGRIGRTSKVLANLEGLPSSKAMMLSGLMQSAGTAMASGSIMGGMAGAGAGAASGATGGYTPNPDYVTDWSKVDWMGGV